MSDDLFVLLSVGLGFVLPVVVLFCLAPWIIRAKANRILNDFHRNAERSVLPETTCEMCGSYIDKHGSCRCTTGSERKSTGDSAK